MRRGRSIHPPRHIGNATLANDPGETLKGNPDPAAFAAMRLN